MSEAIEYLRKANLLDKRQASKTKYRIIFKLFGIKSILTLEKIS